MTALDVVRAGPLTTVQDLGRPGLAHLGVPRSGAADRGALRLANRLVGNPEGAAGLEVTLGGLVVEAIGDLTLAVTGARCPLDLDGVPAASDAVLQFAAGSRLAFGTATAGLRCYLAVRGGLAVAPVLGSRATDTLSGIGPPVLADGVRLPVGPAPDGWPQVEVAAVAAPSGPDVEVALRAVPGPRDDWLDDASRAALWTQPWTVAADSDRVGLRLSGGALRRAAAFAAAELASEGLVRGAVQVPASGQPVVFLADHPVTGGYPVAAVLLDADVDRAAQLRPGTPVRLRPAPVTARSATGAGPPDGHAVRELHRRWPSRPQSLAPSSSPRGIGCP